MVCVTRYLSTCLYLVPSAMLGVFVDSCMYVTIKILAVLLMNVSKIGLKILAVLICYMY